MMPLTEGEGAAVGVEASNEITRAYLERQYLEHRKRPVYCRPGRRYM